LLEHVRDLWTLHGIQSNCTAAIYRNDFGLELRIDHGDELIESRLSRVGEGPLLLIADELKGHLLEQGWFEQPNAMTSPEQPLALPTWRFETEELSAGCYRVRGTDRDGRTVENTDTDPDAALHWCRHAALEIIRSPG
jgi:hypothetical protein